MYELLPNAPAHVHATPAQPGYLPLGGKPAESSRQMGFRAQVPLVDGLKEVMDWIRNR